MAERDLVIGGWHAVRLALELAADGALELWLRQGQDDPAARALEVQARRYGVAVHRAEARTLDRLNGDERHQGVVLRRRPPATLTQDALLARLAGMTPLLLVLDGVQDPRNFGACLRAADGAGVDAVVYPRDKSAPLSSVAAKAASGALDTVALVPVANLARALDALKAAGVWVTGTAHDAPLDIYAADFTAPAALVLGNEGSGLRRLTRERCDHLVSIPMAGRVPSLNVATAAAVCLFEARRQRRAGGGTGQ
ncbi:MAG: 23S rRNA (guanosine(2251)-2'-O)-methyltransferase RlmB [Gammaproteobacteria bacterium]|nr:23S rRNA (guanosine(2251)-2'-O)-methyltransferase RlmB [Gammaproteobacteria bacterium]MCP5201206.1 23S rRNA (guanosine(2251)-2'-O)-methyltransferase RlmB [Gammaproteobacteria bacterium]